jgi:hypothetical protein
MRIPKLPTWLRVTGFVLDHLTWPVVVLLALLLFSCPLFKAITAMSKLGYGSFYVELQNAAKDRGIAEVPKELKGLTSEQLHYFLVVGGETGDESKYGPPMGHERQIRILDELSKRGLMEIVKIVEPGAPDYPKMAGGGKAIIFKTTEKGRKAHILVMDVIYEQLAKGR